MKTNNYVFKQEWITFSQNQSTGTSYGLPSKILLLKNEKQNQIHETNRLSFLSYVSI